MNVLVTGGRGRIGAVVARSLRAAGHGVVEYDLLDGQDILDLSTLERSMRGCDAIVHSAALLGRPGDAPDRIMSVNLQGTWNVLTCASALGVERLVLLSSVDALGVFKGERAPDYLPLDDAHPCYPGTPYGISKRLAEEMCRLACEASRLSVVALRPPGVWHEATYERIHATRAQQPDFEWTPFWEYGAFIDVRDLSQACVRALGCTSTGFRCVLLAAADITTSGPASRAWAERLHPDVEWRGGAEYEADPYRSLIDSSEARKLLDWKPEHSWRDFQRTKKDGA
jgi:nucleoside-diphosphate-sugar epimerase